MSLPSVAATISFIGIFQHFKLLPPPRDLAHSRGKFYSNIPTFDDFSGGGGGGSINRISTGMWLIGVPRPGRLLPNLPIKHTTQ